MISHYQELLGDLDRIRSYLHDISASKPTRVQRQFAYVASVSTLYSSFESYAERVAFRFAQIMLSYPDSLNAEEMSRLRKRYIANSSTLLAKTLGSGRYENVTELDVARSLMSCLVDSDSYDLREEIVTLHNSNLRWDALSALFAWAFEDLRASVGKTDAVTKWLGLAQRPDLAAVDTIESELKLLVERRNEIAHRGNPDEILSPERVVDIVEYIEVISLALIASLGGRILKSTLSRGDSVSLGAPADLYQARRVVIIASLGAEISVGDVVWSSNSEKTRWGTVLGIQLDDESVDCAPPGVEAGIELDFVMHKNSDLHLWRTPIEDLSPPPGKIFGDRGPLESPSGT